MPGECPVETVVTCAPRTVNHWATVLVWLLTFPLLALLLAGCSRAPMSTTVDFATLTRHEPLILQVGDEITLPGYPSEAVEVVDESVLHLLPANSDGAGQTTGQATCVARTRGQTELVVTRSLCETITANCGEPAFYYHLQVQVR